MIRSMTGFGKASEKSPYGKITAEVKTLNHKSLSVNCAPFNGFFLLEEKVKGVLEQKLSRGKVFVKITRENMPGQSGHGNIRVNEDAAEEYLKKIRKMQRKLKLPGDVTVNDVIHLSGVVEVSSEKKEDKLWPYMKKALAAAVKKLVDFRKKEGKRLAADFKRRLTRIGKKVREVKKYEKQCVADYRARLDASIKDIAPRAELDKGRLEAEVALFARNCDIAEEITRLEGHVTAFREVLTRSESEAGKKLDFMAQEMQREANTIGSKSSDFRISECVIELKSQIEKIREQIRNVE
ncbi:MAG: YicC family protein [Candidatus Omnitrophica bacterium]|nr:YicC family protein [Candidatus Omnitrophota bacterium]